MVFGQDVGFTYGPLGYVVLPVFPQTNPAHFLIYCAVIYAVSMFSWLRLRLSASAAGMGGEPAAVSLVLLFAACHLMLTLSAWDPWEMAMCALAASILVPKEPAPSNRRLDMLSICLLAVLTGASPLLRLHQGVVGIALLGLVLVTKRDRVMWFAAPGVVASSFLLLLAWKGQPLYALPGFLRSSMEIVSGYTEAMAFPGPVWQVALALASLGAVAVVGLWARSPISTAVALLLTFIAFKHGVVRQDGRLAPFHFKAAAAVLVAWAGCRAPEKWRYFAILTVANLILGCFVGGSILPWVLDNARDRLTLSHPIQSIRTYWEFDKFVESIQTARPKLMAERLINPEARAFIGDSSVDIVPNLVDLVPANHFKWNPRPVFQSYSVYTPYLDAWNASHYAGPKRPDKLILQWESIDGRNPFFDEPFTWREILNRYRSEMDSNMGMILGPANPAPQPLASIPLGDAFHATWDQWLDVPKRTAPETELIAASVETRLSLWGRLYTQALRGIPVVIEVEYENGLIGAYRTIRANLPSGPIVNPLPTSLEDARPLLSGNWQEATACTVRRIRFVTAKPEQFSRDIRVQWLRLQKNR